MVQKIVNGEAKAGLRSSAIIQDLDAYCPKGHRFSYAILAKVQI